MPGLNLQTCLFVALAGLPALPAMAIPPDLSPDIRQMDFDGRDIVLENSVRIRDGDLSGWPDPELKPLRDKTTPKTDCSVPGKLPGKPDWQRASVIHCTPYHKWVASEAYCAEGQNDQAVLYQVDQHTGRIRVIDGAIPECHSATSLLTINNQLMIGTIRPIEKYRPVSGHGVVVYDPTDATEIDRLFNGNTITAMTEDGQFLWVAGHQGLGWYSLLSGEQKWRYYHYFIGDDDTLRVGLADNQQPETTRLFYENFLHYPITNKGDFIRIAEQAARGERGVWHGGRIPELLPWYLEAIGRYDDEADRNQRHTEKDYTFGMLARLIIRLYGEAEDATRERIAITFEALREQHHSLGRRNHILHGLKTLGLPWRDYETQLRFDEIRRQWLSSPRWNHSYEALCEFISEHPEYRQVVKADFEADHGFPPGASTEACLTGGGAVYNAQRRPSPQQQPLSPNISITTGSAHVVIMDGKLCVMESSQADDITSDRIRPLELGDLIDGEIERCPKR